MNKSDTDQVQMAAEETVNSAMPANAPSSVDASVVQAEPPLQILFEDDWLIAVNKPAGMLVHRSFLDRRETRFVMQTLRDQIGQHVFPVHRLDRPTSGVLLFTKSAEMAKRCAELFQQRDIDKVYFAVVRGFVEGEGRIDYALQEKLDKIADKHVSKDKPAQAAVTDFSALAQVELPHAVGRYPTARYSLMRLVPLTGRKHQLRRHMAHISHPIVGDTTHGDGKHNKLFRDTLQCSRLLLHAHSLGFPHPVDGNTVTITAPFCPQWQNLLSAFGWHI